MTYEESVEQLESLIEAWQLDEADLNQTDINAMQTLLKENEQLKIQISAREEEYRKLDETNKVLSQELTKDNILKQEHLKTCCGISIGDIPKFIYKYNKLEDNWNYIKKMLKEARNKEFNIIGYCGTCTDVDIDFLLNKIQELQGSDSNGNN